MCSPSDSKKIKLDLSSDQSKSDDGSGNALSEIGQLTLMETEAYDSNESYYSSKAELSMLVPYDVDSTDAMSIADKLCEHELLVIFSNTCLSTEDLLNFRLVSRNWRDAATSVLLKRNACQIQLNVRRRSKPAPRRFKTDVDEDCNKVAQVYCNARTPKALLKDLVELIHTSPKFPSTSLRFMNTYAFGISTNDIRDMSPGDDAHVKDLLEFLSLYGHRIKSLCLGNLISRKELRDVLTTHTPNLEFIDLSYLIAFRPSLTVTERTIWVKPLEVPLRINTIRLGPCFSTDLDRCRNVEEILANVKFQSIEDPNESLHIIQHLSKIVGSLNMIPLLSDLLYAPSNVREVRAFYRLSTMNPKLSKLVVDLGSISSQHELYVKVAYILSVILNSSKDTLKHFEISLNPQDSLGTIRIPPMKNLKALRFKEIGTVFSHDQNPETRLPKSFIFTHKTMKQSSENGDTHEPIQINKAEYFPNLAHVELDVLNYRIRNKLMRFFKYDLSNVHPRNSEEDVTSPTLSKKVGDCISSVKSLNFCGNYKWPDMRSATFMANLFPCVKQVRIRCGKTKDLCNSLWILCPLAESIEIYGVSHGKETERKWMTVQASKDAAAANEGREKRLISKADRFFTGFPIELCDKLRVLGELEHSDEMCDHNVDFLRVHPSMCLLTNLKEFKISFVQVSRTFVSKFSGVYAFEKMPRTKITFSHNSAGMTAHEIKDIEKHFEPVASYVQVVGAVQTSAVFH